MNKIWDARIPAEYVWDIFESILNCEKYEKQSKQKDDTI